MKRITSAVGFEVPDGQDTDEVADVIQAIAEIYAETSLDSIEFAHALGFALLIHYKVHRSKASNAHELKQFLTSLIDDTWDKVELPRMLAEGSERQQ